MTIEQIVKQMEDISNSGDPKYSHPDDPARLYQVFMSIGQAIATRMLEMRERENGQSY